MNKRIEELSDQCYYINTYSDKEIFDHKKFAELIVRECDKYVAERWDICEPWMNPGDLLKHFGVEE